MTNLKEYFYNVNNYSDPIIKKFIYDFTDKFNPFLLIALNKEFLNSYLLDLDEMNEWRVKDDFEPLENLIGKEELDKSTNVLCRIFTFSDGVFNTEEVREKKCNLSYNDHSDMTNKIFAFQYCMQEIVIAENSKAINKSRITPEAKLKDYTSEVWFRVGVLIASGELEELLKLHGSARKVASYLDLEKSRPYISDSRYSVQKTGFQRVLRNTNIYNDSTKILKIYNHCKENKISMTADFIDIHSEIKPK